MKPREQRRADAKRLLEEWRKLTHPQQIAFLDRRLGAGQGATKQRARIAAQIKAVDEVAAAAALKQANAKKEAKKKKGKK